jgi:hypothetical protein
VSNTRHAVDQDRHAAQILPDEMAEMDRRLAAERMHHRAGRGEQRWDDIRRMAAQMAEQAWPDHVEIDAGGGVLVLVADHGQLRAGEI